jgi:hypothetical protein
MTDTSDPRQVEKAIKAAKTKDEVREEGLRQLMSSVQGRVWLHSFLMKAPVLGSTFSRDPYQTAFNCGEQNIMRQLVAELHECSTELYLVMMKENTNG